MGISGAPLAAWPWESLGNLKYIMFAPFIARAFHDYHTPTGSTHQTWWIHLVLLCFLRYFQHQIWNSFSRLHLLVKRYQIHQFATSFDQVDREFHCDNFIIFQGLALAGAYQWIPSIPSLPLYNGFGLVTLLALHVFVTEPLYYVIHRRLHSSNGLYCSYHSLHHQSTSPEPATAGLRTFFEELIQSALVAVPLAGTVALGGGSVAMFYVYLLCFDFLKQMGHCNCEIVPEILFKVVPPLRYLMYTPSYHSLHHTELHSNFCLFMPVFDLLGGTMSGNSAAYHSSLRKGRREEVPSFVFLAHCIDILSSLHVSFASRTFSAFPYSSSVARMWYMYIFWPLGFAAFFILWTWGRVFVAYQYFLRGLHAQTWVVPRYGIHYFLPFGLDSINSIIEKAILDADHMGVKVISLAALNKNEALNGGGMLFVQKHPTLRVRVVHGNTLTAAVVLNELPPDAGEVFLTGSTSKLGRAIALYLSRKGVRVLMLTSSRSRYDSILSEASTDQKKYLVQVTKYQAGQHCKTWIIGKWLTEKEQGFAPVGTHFHQFVVPPVREVRRDCTYGKLVGLQLPSDVVGIHTCEYINERGVVAACHAGGLLHALESWSHHEVGCIDVDKIDTVWQAALARGFTPV